MKILTFEQRTPEWFDARRGIPTASNFSKILTTKGEKSKQWDDYRNKLAAARVSGVDEEPFTSKSIEKGIEQEGESRLVYEMFKEVFVEEVGFCLSDCGRFGASPDGLVGKDGMVELKNPKGKTLVKYTLKNKLPSTYFQQVHGQMYVTDRKWCDFVSYCPGLPLLIVRVKPSRMFYDALDMYLPMFCDELDEVCKMLEEKKRRQHEQL